MQSIEYRITPESPRAHQFRVTCTVAEPSPQGQRFSLPAWIPGSYVIRDFARHILSVSAWCNNQPVAVEQADKQSWVCAPCDGPLLLDCLIYARDESVRAAYLDDRRGFFNGTSMFMRPDGAEQLPCRVWIKPPQEAVEGSWQVITTLAAKAVDDAGFGEYIADNYSRLIDYPVALGVADLIEFSVANTPHAIALLGANDADHACLADDLARACEQHVRMFGELPVPGYLFLAQVVGEGYGGLEHRDCSMLQVARDSLPARATAGQRRSQAYVNLLGLCSHEYFHLWNVKRIKPQAVAESDLSGEAHFRDLWAYEGVTSYYDDLALVRAGLVESHDYLKSLAGLVTRIERGPGRLRQSLAQSSFDAWTKFYRPDENSPNAVVSYYGKGALVALSLDLTLRLSSNGELDLDRIMHRLWQMHGRAELPVPEGGLEQLCRQVAGPALDGFFENHVHGRAEPPVPELLAEFGIDCRRSTPEGTLEEALAALGLRLATNSNELQLAHVLDDSAAQAAGLSPGDTLVAMDALRITRANLAPRLGRLTPGSSATLVYFRGDELLACDICVPEKPAPGWRFTIDERASEAAQARRMRWLQGA